LFLLFLLYWERRKRLFYQRIGSNSVQHSCFLRPQPCPPPIVCPPPDVPFTTRQLQTLPMQLSSLSGNQKFTAPDRRDIVFGSMTSQNVKSPAIYIHDTSRMSLYNSVDNTFKTFGPGVAWWDMACDTRGRIWTI